MSLIAAQISWIAFPSNCTFPEKIYFLLIVTNSVTCGIIISFRNFEVMFLDQFVSVSCTTCQAFGGITHYMFLAFFCWTGKHYLDIDLRFFWTLRVNC